MINDQPYLVAEKGNFSFSSLKEYLQLDTLHFLVCFKFQMENLLALRYYFGDIRKILK